MAPFMNQAMLQPLLASDTVRFVGEPVAAVVTEEMYQGEDAIELVDVDYDILPAVVNMNDALAGDKGLLFPEAETNVICTFGDASAAEPDLFDGCEVVVSEVIQNTRVAAGPDGDPLRRRRLGRGRAADRLDPQPGRAGHQGRDRWARSALTPEDVRIITPDVGGGVRRQVRRRRRAGRSPAGSPSSSAGPPAGRRRAWRTCSA